MQTEILQQTQKGSHCENAMVYIMALFFPSRHIIWPNISLGELTESMESICD